MALPRRTVLWVAGVAAVVMLVVVLVLAGRGGGAGGPDAPGTPTAGPEVGQPEGPEGTVGEGAAPTEGTPPEGTASPDPTEPTQSPSPGGGTGDGPVAEPVPPGPEVDPTEPPVALDEPAPFPTEVTARLVRIESIRAEAQGPGEVSGPALRITVELVNDTGEPVSLSSAVVNVYVGEDRAPGEPMTGSGARPFDGRLEDGRRATGVYVFAVPEAGRELVQVTVSYTPDVPTVLFEGPVRG